MLTYFSDVAKLLERRAQGGEPYLEFLRVAAMSAGSLRSTSRRNRSAKRTA
jgi:hypothetical protein